MKLLGVIFFFMVSMCGPRVTMANGNVHRNSGSV